jgi:hypothetical protein
MSQSGQNPTHAVQQKALYSITSSARPSGVGDISEFRGRESRLLPQIPEPSFPLRGGHGEPAGSSYGGFAPLGALGCAAGGGTALGAVCAGFHERHAAAAPAYRRPTRNSAKT